MAISNNHIPAPLPDHTYLGSFDDEVIKNMGNDVLTIKTLNEILISELLFSVNSKILINDGYIAQSPIIRNAITAANTGRIKDIEKHYDQSSPLFPMIETGRVRILTRGDSLVSMIEDMSQNQKIPSYQELTRQEGWYFPFQMIDEDLKKTDLERWPTKYDFSDGFFKLLNNEYNEKGKKAKNLGLKISDDDLKEVFDEFNKQFSISPFAGRTRWKEAVEKTHPQYLKELMDMANQAYHYNFGLCLQAGTSKERNVHVNSISGGLFTDKTTTPKEIECDIQLLDFEIPDRILINKEFITALKTKGELSEIHQAFVKNKEAFLANNPNIFIAVKDEFRRKIIDFDIHNRQRYPETNGQGFHIRQIFSGLKGAIMAPIGLSNPSGLAGRIVIGAITSIAENLFAEGVSSLRERYYYRDSGRYKLTEPKQRFSISSLQISSTKAEEHVDKIKPFIRPQ